jgi:RNA polymerase sigma-70 factor, ECF subfamily
VGKDPQDDDLVQKAAAGCERAFKELVVARYDAIYRMAWRWVGERDEAEDVAQDVCIKLAGAIGGFRGEAEFSTWLYRVTYTVAMDHIRARRRSLWGRGGQILIFRKPKIRSVDDEPIDDPLKPESRSPEIELINKELWREVRALPPQQRDAVLLVYGEDRSHAEAAEILGCSESTVSGHLHTARKRLKERLVAAG